MWVRLPPSPPDITAFRLLSPADAFVAIGRDPIAQEATPSASTRFHVALAQRKSSRLSNGRSRVQPPHAAPASSGCSSAGRVLPSEGRRRWFESNHPDHSCRGSPIGRGSGLRSRSVRVRIPPPVPDFAPLRPLPEEEPFVANGPAGRFAQEANPNIEVAVAQVEELRSANAGAEVRLLPA